MRCSASDVSQVLLNIIINAADAVAEIAGESSRRGEIEVRTWSEDDSVVITVADTGPPELADRVFEPFFMTRSIGRASGRGLATSRALIVERHRGSLAFVSRPGRGTTFTIHLPTRAGNSRPAAAAA